MNDTNERKEKVAGYPVHASVEGNLVLIGFGSIGRGVLPLIERHIDYDPEKFTVVEPSDEFAHILKKHGVRHLHVALTEENYEDTIKGLFPDGSGGMIVNLSVDVDSGDMMELAHSLGIPYIDTVYEPWPGWYFDPKMESIERCSYPDREELKATVKERVGGPTCVTCCGANPGMVSWLMKEALLILAKDTGVDANPKTREEWAKLAMDLGVKGLHIAERDTQVSNRPKAVGEFVNTWSVDGLFNEGFLPAELGWGTHEKKLPPHGHAWDNGPGYAIWIDRPGADTLVRSWVPGEGPQLGYVIVHEESLSIPDYYTVYDDEGKAIYRPTCHYAYHPCNDAILSLHEVKGTCLLPEKKHILTADEITSGSDDLGVLLYGHARGVMWYGTRLSNDEAVNLAPYQNATGLQVTSGVLAAMVWISENPNQGLVWADQMDHSRCLEVQKPYLGRLECHYTDWTPLAHRINNFAENRDDEDPWQFTNFLAK
jgi:homospermidine synthase